MKSTNNLKLIALLFLILFFSTNIKSNEQEKVTFFVFGHSYADYDSLELSIPLINKEDPDFVIFLGDVINRIDDRINREATWKSFEPILKKIKVPVYFAPGNHDILDSPEDLEYFKNKLSISNSLVQEFTLKNNTFILLNSAVLPSPHQDVSKEQVDFVKSIYERDTNNKIIFIHHELFYYKEFGGDQNLNSIWNSEIVPIIKGKTLAVFTGDGGHQPYYSYVEEEIHYFGVKFSVENSLVIPPHMLKVTIEGESLKVTPIPLKQDLTKTPYIGNNIKKMIANKDTLLGKLRSFTRFYINKSKIIIFHNLKLIFLSLLFISLISLIFNLYLLIKFKKINNSLSSNIKNLFK